MSDMKDESGLRAEPEIEAQEAPSADNDKQQQPKRRRKSGRSMFGPILLIALGVLLLLGNLDQLPDLNWPALLRLWPLILIFIGLDVIVRQAGRPVGTFFSFMLALLAVVVAGYVLLYAERTPFVGERLSASAGDVQEERLTFPAAGVQEAEVFVNFGAPGGDVFALQDSNELIDAQVSYAGDLVFESEMTVGQATVMLESSGPVGVDSWTDLFGWFDGTRADPWQIGLSARTPIDLDLNLGSGPVNMALDELSLMGLNVDGGSGSAELVLPSGDYDMAYDVGSGSTKITLPASGTHDFNIDGGSGRLIIYIPETAAVQLTTEGGSGGLRLPDDVFEAQGQSDNDEGRWQTASYADSSQKLELFIDIGSGSVTFERE